MPGEPVETMIGVGVGGMGVLLAYSAYKNVSPLEMIRQFITTGKFVDPSKLPALIAGTGAGIAGAAAAIAPAVAAIKPKNADLANRLQNAFDAYVKNPTSSTQNALSQVITEAKNKGFSKDVANLDSWLTANPPATLSNSSGGGIVPAGVAATPVQAIDQPSGADFGTTSGVGNLVFDPSTGNWVLPV